MPGSLPKSLHVGGIEGQDQVVVHLYRIFQCDDGRAGTSVRERALFITAWSAVSMSRLSLMLMRDRLSAGGTLLRTFSNSFTYLARSGLSGPDWVNSSELR